MKKLINYILITVFISLSSCKINGSFQGLYSYFNKTNKENPKLFVNTSNKDIPICDLKKLSEPKIYIVNGNDIKECVAKTEKSLIYIWGAKCKSDICYDLNLLQKECEELDIRLFVIAEYYDLKAMQIDYNLERPIFGIDTKYYNTNLTSKYLKKFNYDLTGKVFEGNNRYIYFSNGRFENSYRDFNLLIGEKQIFKIKS